MPDKKLTDSEIEKAKAHFEYGIKCDIFQEPVLSYAKTVLEAFDEINRQQAEKDDLFYKLVGVMHSVDKWLDGDELKQDEVNRAATMREKTLQIVESLQAENEHYSHNVKEMTDSIRNYQKALEQAKAENERLKEKCENTQVGYNFAKDESKQWKEEVNRYRKLWCETVTDLETAKTEAYKEFAEKLNKEAERVEIDREGDFVEFDNEIYGTVADWCKATSDNFLKELVGDK